MVDERAVRRWAREVRAGTRSPSGLVAALRRMPFERLGDVRLDTHRTLRRGAPEVIFGEGKRFDQLARIVRRFTETREPLIVTRISPDTAAALHAIAPGLRYYPLARIAALQPRARRALRGRVAVVTAGTSDVPVAEEAAVTLELLGSRPERLYDAGVAGVHRLLAHWDLLQRARVIVVVAGMEGALPSVVGGLVRVPVVAVPTSVGYGASFQGVAPLLTMMNSCAPGISVVNIDNGFGAGYLAHLINVPPR